MSNLLKSNWVILKQDSKRVIDCNPLIANKLDLLQQSYLTQQSSDNEGDFIAGLQVDQIEVLHQVEGHDSKTVSENRVKEANEKAKEIMDESYKKAEVLKEQAFLEGKEKGYQEGKEKAQKELQLKLQELSDKEYQMTQMYKKQLEEMEPLLLNKIADIYQYVFNVEFEKRKDVLLHVIHNTVLKLESSRNYIVRVSHEDYDYVIENANRLSKNISEAKTIEIIEDSSLVKSQCMVETDGGLYDCSIDVELDELTKAIKTLAYIK